MTTRSLVNCMSLAGKSSETEDLMPRGLSDQPAAQATAACQNPLPVQRARRFLRANAPGLVGFTDQPAERSLRCQSVRLAPHPPGPCPGVAGLEFTSSNPLKCNYLTALLRNSIPQAIHESTGLSGTVCLFHPHTRG